MARALAVRPRRWPRYALRVSATTTRTSGLTRSGQVVRSALVLWTVGIWGSRLRNIIADDELVGFELVTSVAVAVFLIAAAGAVGISMVKDLTWHGRALGVLVIAGIARFTTRGIAILASSEWDTGFKIVHTVLWAITVTLSVLAAREYAARQESKIRS